MSLFIEKYHEALEQELQFKGVAPVNALGFNFYLNNPKKYLIYNLLRRLQIQGIIRINGVDDIKREYDHYGMAIEKPVKTLREVIKYAEFIEKKL